MSIYYLLAQHANVSITFYLICLQEATGHCTNSTIKLIEQFYLRDGYI